MSLFGNSEEKSRAELLKLREKRELIAEQAVATEAELTAARIAADEGEVALALGELGEGAATTTRAQIAEIEARLRGLTGAAKAIIGRIEAAALAVRHAKAAALRDEARKLGTRRKKIIAERDKLVAQLRELEHCEFVPDPRPRSVYPKNAAGEDSMLFGQQVTIQIPLSESLGADIDRMGREAVELEEMPRDWYNTPEALQKKSPFGVGAVEGSSFEDLVTAAAALPVEQYLPPCRPAIEKWFRETEAKALAKWEALRRPGPLNATYIIQWTAGGQLDVDQCTYRFEQPISQTAA